MNTRKRSLIHKCIMVCIAGMLVAAAGWAVEKGPNNSVDTVDELLAAIDKADEELDSVRFSFTQKIEIPYSGEDQTIEGMAYFKKPANIRVEHRKPEKNLFVSDGTDVWYYSQELNQVMHGPWKDLENSAQDYFRGIFNINNYVNQLEEYYHISLLDKTDSSYRLSLVPKSDAVSYSMSMVISAVDYFPIQTVLESEAVHIETTIRSIRKNISIDDDRFTFTPPADALVMPFP
ncbi:MAG: hypothetical protein GF384_07950 [Elusimicrobia bacterium]|nr:hypothetical protein [Elusimicrobiota bacterium]MBD3412568.1 hypothetical protein [Elusimicrobiota bacterium]